MHRTASDRRIGERSPWNIAREIALQASREGKPRQGKASPRRTRIALEDELGDLVDPEWAAQMIEQARAELG